MNLINFLRSESCLLSDFQITIPGSLGQWTAPNYKIPTNQFLPIQLTRTSQHRYQIFLMAGGLCFFLSTSFRAHKVTIHRTLPTAKIQCKTLAQKQGKNKLFQCGSHNCGIFFLFKREKCAGASIGSTKLVSLTYNGVHESQLSWRDKWFLQQLDSWNLKTKRGSNGNCSVSRRKALFFNFKGLK